MRKLYIHEVIFLFFPLLILFQLDQPGIYYVIERASKHEAIWYVRGAYPPGIYQIAECFDVLSLLYHSQT
jgi:hypothetical protein